MVRHGYLALLVWQRIRLITCEKSGYDALSLSSRTVRVGNYTVRGGMAGKGWPIGAFAIGNAVVKYMVRGSVVCTLMWKLMSATIQRQGGQGHRSEKRGPSKHTLLLIPFEPSKCDCECICNPNTFARA